MLQRHVEIFADVVVLRDRIEQTPRNPIWIGVKEPQPTQALDAGELVEQRRKPILNPQILAIAGRILPDQRDLLHSACHQSLRLGNYRLKAPRAKFSAQVGNDAEAARMIAAFRDLDIRRCASGRQEARRVFVVEIRRQQMAGALPILAAKAPLLLPMVAFRPEALGPSSVCAKGVDL